MEPLDGNAAGGVLAETFGIEMTTVTGVCADCGASRLVAVGVFSPPAPGVVMRCRACGGVMVVVVDRRERRSVDLRGLVRLEMPLG
jgi:hypothetical protein